MMTQGRTPSVAVLGLGNELLRDDGVGIHAVRRLARTPMESVLLAEIGTAVLRALAIVESVSHVLAIDAVRHNGPAGRIYCFEPDLASRPGFRGLHDLDLPALVSLIPAKRRPALIIVGVEPEVIDYGLSLSPTVESALPELTRQVRRLAQHIARTHDADGNQRPLCAAS